MRWVLGHVGVLGNEQADVEGKAAAEGHSSEERFIPIECGGIMPIRSAAEIQRHDSMLNKKHRAFCAKSPRASLALNIDPTFPSTVFMKLMCQVPRRCTSLLMQLRTGHVPLKKHLAKVGKASSPTCPVCSR